MATESRRSAAPLSPEKWARLKNWQTPCFFGHKVFLHLTQWKCYDAGLPRPLYPQERMAVEANRMTMP